MEIIFLIGRVLLGGFFIWNGYNHLANQSALTGYAKSKGVPMAHAGVVITGIMLLAGGLSVLLNIRMVVGMWVLVVFLAGVTYMMHQFWKVQDPMMKMGERINFTKNVALIGALLMMIAHLSI